MKNLIIPKKFLIFIFVFYPFRSCLGIDDYDDGVWGFVLNSLTNMKCDLERYDQTDMGETITIHWYNTNTGSHKKYALCSVSADILADECFDPSVPWIVYIGGFGSTINGLLEQDMVDALVKIDDVYVFIVDHSNFTDMSLDLYDTYQRAVSYVKPVARNLNKYWLDNILEVVDEENIHVIGHSLGAQIVGSLGYMLAQEGKLLGKCTGLESAGPCFSVASHEFQLSTGDCKFTEAIHTNFGQFGTNQTLTDFEAFANCAGKLQPYCGSVLTAYGITLADQNAQYSSGASSTCSHNYAVKLYANTINESHIGTRCKDYQTFTKGKCKNSAKAVVGYGSRASRNYSGYYFFKTENSNCKLNSS